MVDVYTRPTLFLSLYINRKIYKQCTNLQNIMHFLEPNLHNFCFHSKTKSWSGRSRARREYNYIPNPNDNTTNFWSLINYMMLSIYSSIVSWKWNNARWGLLTGYVYEIQNKTERKQQQPQKQKLQHFSFLFSFLELKNG